MRKILLIFSITLFLLNAIECNMDMKGRNYWFYQNICAVEAGEIIQLTDNNKNDGDVHIDKGKIAWVGYVKGGSTAGGVPEIFFYNGVVTEQLTSDNDDYGSKKIGNIHDGKIVWHREFGDAPSDNGIYLYDGKTVQRIDVLELRTENPKMHNGEVVWSGFDGSDYEIFFFNGSTVKQITSNEYDDLNPSIENGNIVWTTWGADLYEYIYYYNGNEIIEIASEVYPHGEGYTQLNSNKSVWVGWIHTISNSSQVYLIDIDDKSITALTEQFDNHFHTYFDIDDGKVAWINNLRGSVGENNYDYDDDVFFFDGEKRVRLTNNDNFNSHIQIHKGQIVWRDRYQVYFYNGETIIQITNNDEEPYLHFDGPVIYDGTIVWSQSDGNDTEIYYVQSSNNPDDDGEDDDTGNNDNNSGGGAGGCFINKLIKDYSQTDIF